MQMSVPVVAITGHWRNASAAKWQDNVMFIHETSFQWNPKPAPENNGPDAQDLADLRLYNLRWLGDGEWSRKNGKWKQGKKEKSWFYFGEQSLS